MIMMVLSNNATTTTTTTTTTATAFPTCDIFRQLMSVKQLQLRYEFPDILFLYLKRTLHVWHYSRYGPLVGIEAGLET